MGKTKFVLAAALSVLATGALAEYPDKLVTYIMPHAPGGGTDIGIRTWAPYVEACLGNGANIVVTAMPGAGGALGFNALATSAPDGYTLGQLTTPGFVTLDFTMKMPFSRESFDIVGNMVGVSSIIAVHKSGSYNTLQDFLDAAKASEDPVNVGVGSIGNDDHLAGLQFMALSGLKFNLIPFGDNSQTRNALLGGHVEVAMMSNAEIGRFLEDLKPLAIAANERDEKLPEVPTFKELGFNLIAGTTHIIGIPKGGSEEAKAKWQECLANVSTDPNFLADAEKRSVSVMYMDAEQASTHVANQELEYRELFETHPW